MTAPRLTIPDVVDRFKAYHDNGHEAWGSLHIVLEDGNIEDHHIRSCRDYALAAGDAEGAALAELLLQLSKTQRRALPGAAARRLPRVTDEEIEALVEVARHHEHAKYMIGRNPGLVVADDSITAAVPGAIELLGVDLDAPKPGDAVLVVNQPDAKVNGIYTFVDVGGPDRPWKAVRRGAP